MDASSATFVLVGGEAYEWQGVMHEQRELVHTSVTFIGTAYDALRSAGIPRSNIITIVQLQDYLEMLDKGRRDKLTSITGIPAKWYAEHYDKTYAKCRRLMEEGGANYDYDEVNPATVWSVLIGDPSDGRPVVPPDGNGTIVFGIYSHGDCHPAATGGQAAEWFAHFPYRSNREDIYNFVATEGSKDAGVGKNRPLYYLYATQLRLIFHKIFERSPSRPILGLLNYCLSGGNLDFMRREAVRTHLGVDRWPLLLMSSSQAGRDSMVAGMWDAWFGQLQKQYQIGSDLTVMDLYHNAVADYYKQNSYELLNAVKARVYVREVWRREFLFPGQKKGAWDPWHVDLYEALKSCLPTPGGDFTFRAVEELQRAYESGESFSLIRRPTAAQRELLVKAGGVAIDADGSIVVWTSAAAQKRWQSMSASQFAELNPQPYKVQLIEYALTEETGICKSLEEILQKALKDVAHPEEVHGSEALVSRPLSSIF